MDDDERLAEKRLPCPTFNSFIASIAIARLASPPEQARRFEPFKVIPSFILFSPDGYYRLTGCEKVKPTGIGLEDFPDVFIHAVVEQYNFAKRSLPDL